MVNVMQFVVQPVNYISIISALISSFLERLTWQDCGRHQKRPTVQKEDKRKAQLRSDIERTKIACKCSGKDGGVDRRAPKETCIYHVMNHVFQAVGAIGMRLDKAVQCESKPHLRTSLAFLRYFLGMEVICMRVF